MWHLHSVSIFIPQLHANTLATILQIKLYAFGPSTVQYRLICDTYMRDGGDFLTFGMSKQLTLCLAGVAMARFYYTALHCLLRLTQQTLAARDRNKTISKL